MLSRTIARLHKDYVTYRNDGVPFPLESVIAWYVLLALQEQRTIRGNIMEMGVEHGGTAFLGTVALREDEHIDLIDLKKSPRFAKVAERLPTALASRVHFHECSTRAPELAEIAKQLFRFVHIDAGHSKQDVLDDIGRFAGCVAPDGILCLDDVFEIRWPGVTEAIFEAIPSTGLVPFLLVNRKLYLAHKDMAGVYRDMLVAALPEIEVFGNMRHWTEEMLGGVTLIWKQALRTTDLNLLLPSTA
ncbi:class I SAM-dependent methyltransferase [Roseovarius sp.]|uniref:class I SAM-dependent methyltransferase n=1 Tax=Roseovarius sp. TaxID=1486281 RepID=UPI003A97DA83